MKNKKAFLLGEYTLKVIIAVICLLFLFYLIFRIYSSYKDNQNLSLAEASLNDILEKMEEAKVKGESEVLVLNPDDSYFGKWWVIAWPYQNEGKKPGQCFEDYCVCICEMGRGRSDSLNKCKSLGTCKGFTQKIITLTSDGKNVPILIKNPPLSLKIKYDKSEGFTISEK
jgi:hypothetical protein